MIEAILLSSMLNFSQAKEKPYQPQERMKVYYSKNGIREEDILIKHYFVESEFQNSEKKYLKINKIKGGKNGRFK